MPSPKISILQFLLFFFNTIILIAPPVSKEDQSKSLRPNLNDFYENMSRRDLTKISYAHTCTYRCFTVTGVIGQKVQQDPPSYHETMMRPTTQSKAPSYDETLFYFALEMIRNNRPWYRTDTPLASHHPRDGTALYTPQNQEKFFPPKTGHINFNGSKLNKWFKTDQGRDFLRSSLNLDSSLFSDEQHTN